MGSFYLINVMKLWNDELELKSVSYKRRQLKNLYSLRLYVCVWYEIWNKEVASRIG